MKNEAEDRGERSAARVVVSRQTGGWAVTDTWWQSRVAWGDGPDPAFALARAAFFCAGHALPGFTVRI